MKNIIKEPLVHFLILGALLFITFEYLNPQTIQDNDTIYIGKNEIKYIKDHFRQRFNRNPTKKEFDLLLTDYITTEAYYKEALSLGLDKNDNIIKRLLRKKMEMMSKNVLSLIDITDKQLQEYLDKHKNEFIQDTIYVFDQVQIDPKKHKNTLANYLYKVKNALDNNKTVKSDSLIVQPHFSGISKGVLDGDFGENFSKELDRAKIGVWSGPIQSNLGIHFIKIDKRIERQAPLLENIRDQLTKSYIKSKQQDILEKQRKELLKKYKVVINKAPSKQDGVN